LVPAFSDISWHGRRRWDGTPPTEAAQVALLPVDGRAGATKPEVSKIINDFLELPHDGFIVAGNADEYAGHYDGDPGRDGPSNDPGAASQATNCRVDVSGAARRLTLGRPAAKRLGLLAKLRGCRPELTTYE
jgi:hypothetical protein